MKANIEELKDSFQLGYESYEDSREEANLAWDLYHNRQFTQEQLAVLEQRGQPAETFNIIKMFTRMLVGYYSTVVNTVVTKPRNPRDVINANVMNDTINYILEENRFDIEGDSIKLGGLISGLLTCYCNVEDTGERDDFNRPINRVTSYYVPDYELVLDPASKLDDYSDARFLHRFRWVTKDVMLKTFGADVLDKLDAQHNHLNIPEAEYDYQFNSMHGTGFNGRYRVFDNYLLVHTVMEDEDGKRWSVFWSGDIILSKKEITFKEARWPYRVQRLHSSNKCEYYGIFREVLESQKALNQAVISIQLMVNSEKVLVEDDAVQDIDEFANAYNRVNAVIPVLKLSGVRVESLSREIQEQYIIIDRALDRIQRILGINDSFLGMAFASDSGRKVKLQQNATIMSLRYITARIESFYTSLGYDIAYLVKQYYYANQILLITDSVNGDRWVELNKPMMEFSGKMDPQGQPIYQPILMPMTNPETKEEYVDEEGNIILAPVNDIDGELRNLKFTIKIESNSYNDEDEKGQLLLETVISGQIGVMLSQVNPSGFFKMAELAMKTTKTRYSLDIAKVLNETSQMLGQNPEAQQQASMMAQGTGSVSQPMSESLKLPQNTTGE